MTSTLKPFAESDFQVDQSQVEIGRELGRGNFSHVFKGQYNKQAVAVKQQELIDADLERYLLNELAILRLLNHNGCIGFFGAFKSTSPTGAKLVNILTEYIEGGDLHRLILDKQVPLGWKYRTRIALGVAQALHYMHDLEIIHRDIKTENVLLGMDGQPKLCDFGFARKWNKSRQMTMCGTDEFMAPEICFGMEYDEKIDIFSYGILLAELLTRRTPGKEGFLDRDAQGGFEVNLEELEAAAAACGAPQSLLLLTKECVPGEAHNRLSAADAAAWLEDFYKELADDLEPQPVLSAEALRDKINQYLVLDTKAKEQDLAEEDEGSELAVLPQIADGDRTGGDAASSSSTSTTGLFQFICGSKIDKHGLAALRRKDAAKHQEMVGWVTKRGGRIKTWKRRYMVVTSTGIVYFKSPEDHQLGAEAQGAINFTEMTAVAGVVCNAVPTVMTGKPLSFGVHTGDRTYYIAAATPEERGKWIRAITDGHRYFIEQQKKRSPLATPNKTGNKKQ